MTLQQLKYVSMVERCGSFSKADQKLYVSQPSVSNLVHGLEELMDYPCIVYEQSADSPAFYSEEMLLPNFYPPRVVYISDLYVSTALMRSCNAYDIGTGVISPRLAREVACVAIDTADTVDIGWIGIRGKALRPIEEAFLRHLAHQPEMAKA